MMVQALKDEGEELLGKLAERLQKRSKYKYMHSLLIQTHSNTSACPCLSL